MKYFILLIVVVLTSYSCSKAQSLKAISQSGAEETYSLNKPLTITFDSTSFIFTSGSTIIKKWGFGELRIIIDDVNANGTIDVKEQNIPTQSNLVHVYPQPIFDKFNVFFQVPLSGPVHLNIYSLVGDLVYSHSLGYLVQGEHTSTVTIPFISTGQYILSLQGNLFLYNIPLIHLEGQ